MTSSNIFLTQPPPELEEDDHLIEQARRWHIFHRDPGLTYWCYVDALLARVEHLQYACDQLSAAVNPRDAVVAATKKLRALTENSITAHTSEINRLKTLIKSLP